MEATTTGADSQSRYHPATCQGGTPQTLTVTADRVRNAWVTVAIRVAALMLVSALLLGQDQRTAPRDAVAAAPTAATGVIRGRVLDDDTGQPLARAIVNLRGTVRRSDQEREIIELSVSTDESGSYAFTDVAPGTYQLFVTKSGFVSRYYGRRNGNLSVGAPTIDLGRSQIMEASDILLAPSGVIEGQVLDHYGEPVAGVRVSSMRPRYGTRVISGFALSGWSFQADEGRSSSETDDHGRFRIYNLDAGPHYLSATLPAGGSPINSIRAFFHPGTFSPSEAQPVLLTAGQNVGGVLLQVADLRPVTVSGTVALANGLAAKLTAVALTRLDVAAIQQARLQGQTFSLVDVLPGEYVLVVQTDTRETLITQLNVAARDVVLALKTSTGGAVRGRITFDGERPSSIQPGDVRLSFSPAPVLSADQPRVADDWTFESPRAVGTGVLREGAITAASRASPPAQAARWMLKGVFRRGVDVTDTPIDFTAGTDDLVVVLTTRVSGVTGMVTGARGPASDADVIVFADDRQRWGAASRFVRAARSDQSGRFTIARLPPGLYLAAASRVITPGDEQNPQVLEMLRRTARTLTIAEGETASIDLELEP